MIVKKHKGKPFGAVLTVQERMAMKLEINRQIAEQNEKNKENIDAMILYVLMAHYGWKKQRLHKFWKAFITEFETLQEHYQNTQPEYLAHEKLKEIGVDIHEWYKECEQDE